ncbi:PREDICTED: blue copper protein [Tarenaya hassleriana]|uniref:blue copper protein n=1 Tax=Tarenaya hassleriana TaxID=28532 RepID=UPI00053C8A21|nr:PREDICTED: blue copper protein [Tarenaya hassleriana]
MEQRLIVSCCSMFLVFVALSVCLSSSVDAYKNHTVGESMGWFDDQEKPGVDFQKWADSKSFSLGDFLIFNTDSNHSVIQTYNLTTYKLCNGNDANGNDTTEWSEANPSATTPVPVSVAVPLVREGMNYFFSGNYDGEQCRLEGQRFKIDVKHGQGLRSPPSDEDQTAPGPDGSPQSGDDEEAAPDTIVPANFDNPKDIESDDDDEGKNRSGCMSMFTYRFWFWNCVVLVLMGLFVF